MTPLILLVCSHGFGLREAIAVAQSHVALYLLFALWEEERISL